jgi:undecaprenyl pyrophosphate phosphatase UppP
MTLVYYFQLIYSAIIGIIQGISEWLPISSKTQIIVSSSYLLKLTFQQAYTFGLFMEIGTIIAAVVYFRKEIVEMIQVLLDSKNKAHRKLLIYVVVVTLITGIIAAPLYLVADSINGIAVGIPMLIVGLVLIADAAVLRYSEKRRGKGVNSGKLENFTLRDYLLRTTEKTVLRVRTKGLFRQVNNLLKSFMEYGNQEKAGNNRNFASLPNRLLVDCSLKGKLYRNKQ